MSSEHLTHIPEDISDEDSSKELVKDKGDIDINIQRYIKSMFPESYVSPMKCDDDDDENIPPIPSAPSRNRVRRLIDEDMPTSPLGSLSGLVSIYFFN